MLDTLSLTVVAPEILLMVMACAILLVDLSVKTRLRDLTYVLTLATLAAVAWLCANAALEGQTHYAFGKMVVSDPMGNWLKAFAAIAVGVTLVYSRPYAADRDMLRGGELFTLSLFSLIGIFVMVSGSNFLVIYMGLELLTLSSYALVALRRDDERATEAAMKYFVLGAMASGFLLYGISMMYGATGSLNIDEVFKAIGSGRIKHEVLVFGLVFIVAGLAFKLGAVPFHMWIPDVYQGAPTAVTLMIGAAPELAAFGMTIRLLVEGLIPLAIDWQQMLTLLAVGSLALGNLAAIAQTNLKRMLAYSTIAQMGFVVLGLAAGVVNGSTANGIMAYSASMFYIVTYVLTTLGTFGVIMLLSRQGFESENIDDLKGLARRSPWYAGVMAIFMFSLAGLPPTVGFYAKFSVLQAIVVTNVTGYIVLAVAAVMFSLIGAFYYLRIVKVMYFDEPTDTSPIVASGEVKTLLSLNGAAVLLFGLLPGGLMALCVNAIGKALTT